MATSPKQTLPPLPETIKPASLQDAEVQILRLGHSLNEHAFLIGDLLLWAQQERKKQRIRGRFDKYVEDTFWFSARTGHYMKAHAMKCRAKGRLLPYEPSAAATLAESDEWYTPEVVIDGVRKVLGGQIDLDPATCEAANKIVRAPTWYTKEQDGLTKDWRGRTFLNPPYCSQTGEFIAKLMSSRDTVPAAVVLLGFQHLTAPWSHMLWDHSICLVQKRLNFRGPDGKEHQTKTWSILVCVGDGEYLTRFRRTFSIFMPGGLGPIIQGPNMLYDHWDDIAVAEAAPFTDDEEGPEP